MARIVISSFVLSWMLNLAQTGDAQLVRVGPGGAVSVRAPFVRVEVGRYGGTYVRAPFTSIYAPGFRSRVRYYRGPAPPNFGYDLGPLSAAGAEPDVAQMSLPEFRRSLVTQWNALQQDLNRFATGASWQRHLQLPQDLLAEHASPSAAAESEHSELQKVLNRYERVANAGEYQVISRLPSFQVMRRLLSVYLDRLREAPAEVTPAPIVEELPPPLPMPPPL